MASEKQIIIEIRGGLVQVVYSHDPTIGVDVLDYDCMENGEDYELKEIQRIEAETKGMIEIY